MSLRNFLVSTRRRLARVKPVQTADYWETRYSTGGTSGRGSYGAGAQFKADVLNRIVADHEIESVVDLGCGDGNQLSLAAYPRYVGLDISPTAVATCEQRFRDDSTKRFQVYDPHDFDPAPVRADMSMSIEVIFHLIEDDLFDLHMTHLFALATRTVVIMSSDDERPAKGAHVRRRAFTPWIAENAADWELAERIGNPRKGGPDAGARSDIYVYRRRGGMEPPVA